MKNINMALIVGLMSITSIVSIVHSATVEQNISTVKQFIAGESSREAIGYLNALINSKTGGSPLSEDQKSALGSISKGIRGKVPQFANAIDELLGTTTTTATTAADGIKIDPTMTIGKTNDVCEITFTHIDGASRKCGCSKADHIVINGVSFCPDQVLVDTSTTPNRFSRYRDLIKDKLPTNGKEILRFPVVAQKVDTLNESSPPPAATPVIQTTPVVIKPDKKKITLVKTAPTGHTARPMP